MSDWRASLWKNMGCSFMLCWWQRRSCQDGCEQMPAVQSCQCHVATVVYAPQGSGDRFLKCQRLWRTRASINVSSGLGLFCFNEALEITRPIIVIVVLLGVMISADGFHRPAKQEEAGRKTKSCPVRSQSLMFSSADCCRRSLTWPREEKNWVLHFKQADVMVEEHTHARGNSMIAVRPRKKTNTRAKVHVIMFLSRWTRGLSDGLWWDPRAGWPAGPLGEDRRRLCLRGDWGKTNVRTSSPV